MLPQVLSAIPDDRDQISSEHKHVSLQYNKIMQS